MQISSWTFVSTYGLLLYLFFQIVSTAEKDKELFESKFFTSAEVIDSLKQQMEDLSSRLVAAEENIKRRKFLVCWFVSRENLLVWKWLSCYNMVYRNFSMVLLLKIFIHSSNTEVKHAGEKELEELKLEKEQTENSYLNEQCRTANLLKEKGKFHILLASQTTMSFLTCSIAHVKSGLIA